MKARARVSVREKERETSRRAVGAGEDVVDRESRAGVREGKSESERERERGGDL